MDARGKLQAMAVRRAKAKLPVDRLFGDKIRDS